MGKDTKTNHEIMTSVFSPFTNCDLYLKRYLGTVFDGDNEIPQTEEFKVRAMLQNDSNKPDIKLTNYPGVNVSETKFRGYITEKLLPGTTAPQDCRVVFDNQQAYNLVLHLPPPSPFYDEAALLGVACILETS